MSNQDIEASNEENTQCRKPKWQEDYVTNFSENGDHAMFAFQIGEDSDICRNLFKEKQEVIAQSNWKWDWNIGKSQTWKSINKPDNIRALDTKWIFTRKEGIIEIVYKGRLVV